MEKKTSNALKTNIGVKCTIVSCSLVQLLSFEMLDYITSCTLISGIQKNKNKNKKIKNSSVNKTWHNHMKIVDKLLSKSLIL